jgi:hypothetical protein
MTEKRFVESDGECVRDNLTGDDWNYAIECLNVLNHLHEDLERAIENNKKCSEKIDALHDEKIRLIRENTGLKKKLKEHNDMLKWHQGGW